MNFLWFPFGSRSYSMHFLRQKLIFPSVFPLLLDGKHIHTPKCFSLLKKKNQTRLPSRPILTSFHHVYEICWNMQATSFAIYKICSSYGTLGLLWIVKCAFRDEAIFLLSMIISLNSKNMFCLYRIIQHPPGVWSSKYQSWSNLEMF